VYEYEPAEVWTSVAMVSVWIEAELGMRISMVKVEGSVLTD
jgi:hypothetical protein